MALGLYKSVLDLSSRVSLWTYVEFIAVFIATDLRTRHFEGGSLREKSGGKQEDVRCSVPSERTSP